MFRSPHDGFERDGDSSNTGSSNTIVHWPPLTSMVTRPPEDLMDLAGTTIATATSMMKQLQRFMLAISLVYSRQSSSLKHDLASGAWIWPAAHRVRGRTTTDDCKGLEVLRPAAGLTPSTMP
jgi:hypothetical protein